MAASPEQAVHIQELLVRARGTVLELGPGGGDQMYHFKVAASRIDHIYGIEPTTELHASLLQQAKVSGLGNRYTALAAQAEPQSLLPALKKAGILPAEILSLPDEGIFDTIIAIKSLCSVSSDQVKPIAAILQALLKPGGEFLFFEHVGNNTDTITQLYCRCLDLVWPTLIGGCRLDGRLDRVVLGMSGWQTNVRTTDEFKGYNVFRYVKGICRRS